MLKKSDFWFIVACLIILIGFLLAIFYGMWGFRKIGKCEEAQKYIAECYQREGDFGKVIDSFNRVITIGREFVEYRPLWNENTGRVILWYPVGPKWGGGKCLK